MGQPRPLFVYFRLFKKTLQIIEQINVKNVHPISGAGIQTHNLLIKWLLLVTRFIIIESIFSHYDKWVSSKFSPKNIISGIARNTCWDSKDTKAIFLPWNRQRLPKSGISWAHQCPQQQKSGAFSRVTIYDCVAFIRLASGSVTRCSNKR